jgi:hypothetical protein
MTSLEEVREAYVEALRNGSPNVEFWKVVFMERLLIVSNSIAAQSTPSGIAAGKSEGRNGRL